MLAPNIFSFEDYRLFMHAYYVFKKTMNPRISYMGIARRVGISKAHLIQVIRRRRNISEDKIEGLVRALGLLPTEERYFKLLVVENQTAITDVKIILRNEMQTIRRGAAKEATDEGASTHAS